jgi:hypothetical protein
MYRERGTDAVVFVHELMTYINEVERAAWQAIRRLLHWTE